MVASLTGHTNRVLYLAMSPDGETIVTGAGDETLRFWNAFPKKEKNERGKESRLDYGRLIRWVGRAGNDVRYLNPSTKLQLRPTKTKHPPRTCMRIRSMFYMPPCPFPTPPRHVHFHLCKIKLPSPSSYPQPRSVNALNEYCTATPLLPTPC